MYNTQQGGVTVLAPINGNRVAVRECIRGFESTEADNVHFIAIALVCLHPQGGEQTHVIIEANFDKGLREFAIAWASTQSKMIEKLLGLLQKKPVNHSEDLADRLFSFLSKHDQGTGTYYTALAGVSVNDIHANKALFETVRKEITTPDLPIGKSPSKIFSALKENHPVADSKRNYRVRFGAIAFSVVSHIIMFSVIFCAWMTTGLWGEDKASFAIHFRDATTVLVTVSLFIAFLEYFDYRCTRSRSGVIQRDGGQPGLKLARLSFFTLVLVLLLWVVGALTTSTPLFLLMFFLVALLWPGAALMAAAYTNPFTNSEEVLRRFLLWSLAGIICLLFLHWLSPGNGLVERSTTLLTTLLAIVLTIAIVLFKNRTQGNAKGVNLTWIIVPILITTTMIFGTINLNWVTLIVIPIGLLHWLALEFLKIRTLEHEQRAIKPASVQHLNDITSFEDLTHKHHNHLLSVTHVHPKRVLILKLILKYLKIAIYWVAHQGTLIGIPTIHFARWVLVQHENHHFLIFLSNYDGPFDSYLDEFIDNAAAELNLIWGHSTGFPKTRWLAGGGANRREEFKRFARSSQVASLYHYSAYPNTSVNQIEEQIRLRRALASEVSEGEQADLLKLFQ